MSALLDCRDCGKEFEARRSDARRCPECNRIHRKAYLHEYDHGKRRGQCIDCGKDIGNRATRCLVCGNKARRGQYTGEASSNWKRGITRANGYVYRRVKRGSGGAGQAYKAEHHIVCEQTYGEPLPKGWVVHHLNGIRDDNRPENLERMPRHYHHTQPREALRPYEERIRKLEEQIRELQD